MKIATTTSTPTATTTTTTNASSSSTDGKGGGSGGGSDDTGEGTSKVKNGSKISLKSSSSSSSSSSLSSLDGGGGGGGGESTTSLHSSTPSPPLEMLKLPTSSPPPDSSTVEKNVDEVAVAAAENEEEEEEEEITIFTELSQLCPRTIASSGGITVQLAWKETARWVKYEENVEESGTRWSKPYVSTVKVAAFLQLRQSLKHGVVLLDTPQTTFDGIVEEFLQCLMLQQQKKKKSSPSSAANHHLTTEQVAQIRQLLLAQKRHQFQQKNSFISSFADLRSNSSSNFLKLLSRSSSKINCTTMDNVVPQSTTTTAMPALATMNTTAVNVGSVGNLAQHPPHPPQQFPQLTRTQSNLLINNNNNDNNGNDPIGSKGSTTVGTTTTTTDTATAVADPQLKSSFSSTNLLATTAANEQSLPSSSSSGPLKFNDAFRKKLPHNALGNNILIAEVDFLSAPVSAWIRLQHATKLGDITEVEIPTKFIYIYLGPKQQQQQKQKQQVPGTTTSGSTSTTTGPTAAAPAATPLQIGRALGTLMADSVFRNIVLRAHSIDSLVLAIDTFLDDAPILPPNLWDPATRLEPPQQDPPSAQKNTRKNNSYHQLLLLDAEDGAGVGAGGIMMKDDKTVVPIGSNNSILSLPTGPSVQSSYYNHAFDLDGGGSGVTDSRYNSLATLSTNVVVGSGPGAQVSASNGGGKSGFKSGYKFTASGDGGGGGGEGFLLSQLDHNTLDSDDEEERERAKNGLVPSGRLFGGLIDDIKRKAPHYVSDFRDALALQSVASIIFLYFACLTPIITFGGLLGDATGNNIATMESLICGALCGIVYGFFSGQPLTILGSTGPVLVFETIVYDFCSSHDLNYLSLRFWIGIWVATILLIFVAVDASYLVCYITRFTEENFASLISVIFIYKAIEKLFEIDHHYPLNTNPDRVLNYDCSCMYPNTTTSILLQSSQPNQTAVEHCTEHGGILFGKGCDTPVYVPDVFLFSIILLVFTYIISIQLKAFRQTRFFTAKIRELISDFAVPIAITIMTVLDNLSGVRTPKLEVPSQFNPTIPTRPWVVDPFHPSNPLWTPAVALFPALLATILIFMDQQITAVIVNRKENKLKKGCGYHLDLFILCILICICSIFGLPWFVAATVLSITHVNSLTMYSECAAPGDKPKFLGVREQRVTQIVIFILCGLSIFFTTLLQRIPMPVLYGVFLYMGISSLKGSQFIDRILIIFMPAKYQPDYMFLRRVNIYRVHLFTAIQFLGFVFLWVVKSVKSISITFPLMLLVILAMRKGLDWIFTEQELKILDDKMPESKRKKKERVKAKLAAAANAASGVVATKVNTPTNNNNNPMTIGGPGTIGTNQMV